MEHVDFYRGRGKDAIYLGTIYANNAGPESLRLRKAFSTQDAENYPVDDTDFQERLYAFFGEIGAQNTGMTVHRGDRGWPHPWPDSASSPWSACFKDGALWIHEYGHVVETSFCNGFRNPSEFPSFAPRGAP